MFFKLLGGLAMIVVSANAWCAVLQDNDDGTVTDPNTGNTWQQRDEDKRRNWENARSYCEDLSLGSKTDWRLPTVTELASIVVHQTANPTIDESLFPSTKSSGYWSATSMAGNNWQAWRVDFKYGPVDFARKTNSHYVRCIR